ncbi:MAG: acyl--CoA ligase [Rhodocyclaceae bacterium]|nr:acyl--CoA ligase [Rhodocyclaceae bacterium]
MSAENGLAAQIEQSQRQLCAPGAPFEVTEANIAGRVVPVFRNSPVDVREAMAPARGHGEREFLVYLDQRWSYRKFFEQVDALTGQLATRYGIGRGDRVAIAMRNRPEWLAAFVAVISAGATVVPLNSWGQREELLHGLTDSAPKLCFCDEPRFAHVANDLASLGIRAIVTDTPTAADAAWVARYDDLVAAGAGAPVPAVTLAPDDDAIILYTSGTTSQAKGVVSSHRAICQALTSFDFGGALAGMTSPESVKLIMSLGFAPTVLTAVPLFHVSGLLAHFLYSLRTGRRMVMMYKWDVAEALRLIERERITAIAASTAMIAQLLGSPAFASTDTRSLTAIGLGGSGVTRRVVDLIEATRPNAMPGIGYGLTESNGIGTISAGAIFRHKPTSSGVRVPIMEIRTIDAEGRPLPQGATGEICLKGVAVMSGYWRDAGATARVLDDGWFATGDVGYIDDEGFLFVVDRIKDIVNRGGEKISTAEVESCVSRLPQVAEVAGFALPDADLGEVLALAVRLHPGASLGEDAIRAHVGEHLAAFKVPARILFFDSELPRNPSGKLLRRVLREQAARGEEA